MEKIKVFDSGLKLIVKKMSGIYTAHFFYDKGFS